ncbi:MAG: hypothetical protein WBQ41_06165 [Solirubrobacterales bacterium]
MKAPLLAGIAMILALAVATADASGPVAEASGKRPLLISNCVKPKFKPAKVIIACGDASLGARELTWSKWTHKLALGTGTGRVNDCDPDCVHGTMKTGPMQLLLSHPRTCSNGRRLFTKLHYTWTGGPPAGPVRSSVPVGCKLANL